MTARPTAGCSSDAARTMVGRGAGLRQLDIALLQLLQARVQAIDPNTVDAELTAGLFDVGVALGREACGLPLEGESWA